MGDVLLDPPMGTIQQGAFLSPARTNIGEEQSLAKLACGVCATVADGIRLENPRPLLIPVKTDPYRNLAFQECSRLGSIFDRVSREGIPCFPPIG